MTASLQHQRLIRIQELLALRGENLEIVQGPKEMEEVKRYSIHTVGKTVPWAEVDRTLGDGGKVLWVTNTVDRATAIAKEAQVHLDTGAKPQIYHSRYRYIDRVQHHRGVVDAFTEDHGPVIAITTQVCEVSLDISADMMVTDIAPIPADSADGQG